jgi:hypothetical protein
MNKFETDRLRLKIVFVVCAILLPIVLPILAPSVGIREGGRISLNGLQVLYAVLSMEIAATVYMWGVGNWSRYEPPHRVVQPPVQASDSPQTPGLGSVTPSSSGAGAPAQGGD